MTSSPVRLAAEATGDRNRRGIWERPSAPVIPDDQATWGLEPFNSSTVPIPQKALEIEPFFADARSRLSRANEVDLRPLKRHCRMTQRPGFPLAGVATCKVRCLNATAAP